MIFRNNQEKIDYARHLLKDALPFSKPFTYYRILMEIVNMVEPYLPSSKNWKVRFENKLQERLKESVIEDMKRVYSWDELLFMHIEYQSKLSKK